MRILALFIAMMFLAGCATKAPPPPAPQMIVIPVQLVNYDKRQNLVINEVPDTEDLKKITAESPAEAALTTMIVYTAAMSEYARAVESNLSVCTAESNMAHDKLDKIKQFILLRQGPVGQPAPTY